jgi:hypothetical protein
MTLERIELINTLENIASRLDERKNSRCNIELIGKLEQWKNSEDKEELAYFEQQWSSLVKSLLTTPQLFFFIFRNLAENDKEIFELITRQHYEKDLYSLEERPEEEYAWLEFQSNYYNNETMTYQIIQLIEKQSFNDGKPFEVFSMYFTFIDLLYGFLVKPSILPTQLKVFSLLYQQTVNWKPSYCNGYAYQGAETIGISGIKPNEIRMQAYNIDEYLNDQQQVLDIGSNSGFMSQYVSHHCKQVDALEYNPYLCQIGKVVADSLSINNVEFICDDFYLFHPDKKYDVVFSLANHATIDKKLSINFEDYMLKIFNIMNPEGYLFFESHDVFGHGTGAPGDDGDLDLKFDIAEQYFEVIKHKMVPKFVPCDDIDKLFMVLKRRPEKQPDAVRTFSRLEAIKKFDY